MKEIEDDTNRWKDITCSWIGRFNTAKMTRLHKEIYRFHIIPLMLPIIFFMEVEEKILKLVSRHKRPWIAKATLRKKTEMEGSSSLTSDYRFKFIKIMYIKADMYFLIYSHFKTVENYSLILLCYLLTYYYIFTFSCIFWWGPLESLHQFTSMIWSSTSSNIFLRVNGEKLFMFYLLEVILILPFSLVYSFSIWRF